MATSIFRKQSLDRVNSHEQLNNYIIEMIETIKASGAENGYFEKWAGYQAGVNTQNVKNQPISRSFAEYHIIRLRCFYFAYRCILNNARNRALHDFSE